MIPHHAFSLHSDVSPAPHCSSDIPTSPKFTKRQQITGIPILFKENTASQPESCCLHRQI